MTSCSNAQHSEACCFSFSAFVRWFLFLFSLFWFLAPAMFSSCFCSPLSASVCLSQFDCQSLSVFIFLKSPFGFSPGSRATRVGWRETLSDKQAEKNQKERTSFFSELVMFLTLFLLTLFFLLLSKFHLDLFLGQMIRFLCLTYLMVPNQINTLRFRPNTLLF